MSTLESRSRFFVSLPPSPSPCLPTSPFTTSPRTALLVTPKSIVFCLHEPHNLAHYLPFSNLLRACVCLPISGRDRNFRLYMPQPLDPALPTPSYDLLGSSEPSTSSYQRPGPTVAIAKPTPGPPSPVQQEVVFVYPNGVVEQNSWPPMWQNQPRTSANKGKRRADDEGQIADDGVRRIRMRRDESSSLHAEDECKLRSYSLVPLPVILSFRCARLAMSSMWGATSAFCPICVIPLASNSRAHFHPSLKPPLTSPFTPFILLAY